MKPQIYQLFSISSLLVSISLIVNSLENSASAQITATPSDAGTVIRENGTTLNINGGTQTGTNLFHSFEKFGVKEGQTANFISKPEIKNILGKVTGGDASLINGIIQVTGGNSNLYLMNPSGIIFGSGARLDIPGSFTATTASGIGFGDKWLNTFGANNYADLVGEPNSFAFNMSQPGAIFNAGNLEVGKEETLNLLGGSVINTGTLKSEGGNINIAAIPGKKLVKITQEGNLLSLGLPTSTQSKLNPLTFTPLSLPQLLTGGNLNSATGVTVENGVIKLTGSGVEIPNDVGTAIVSGNVDISGDVGGKANILGETVGIIDGNINATGKNGGGTVLIGGDYKGEGTVPNAKRTVISRDSVVKADAEDTGNGGKVIAWADETTVFQGTISARGGKKSGDGGFVEVSGKENLAFDGFVDVGADFGKGGELLLDPRIVVIGTDDDDDAQLDDQKILKDDRDKDDRDKATFKISANKIVEALSRGDVTIEATEKIDIKDNFRDFNFFSIDDNAHGLTLNARKINVDNSFVKVQGNLNLFGTDELNIEGSQIASKNGNIKLESSSGNVTLLGTELSSGGDIEVRSPGIVKLSETTGDSGKPFVARAKGNINVEGNTGIEITAFENPDSILRSGGDFNLVSNTNIIGNARISSGGSFNAGSGSLTQSALSLYGIISSNGDVNFGDYTGSSLKVEAKGNIRGGNIKIDEAGKFPQTGDPDINILNAGGALILRAGVTELKHNPQSENLGSTVFTSTTNPSSQANIKVGDIDTSRYVTLSAKGDIVTGSILTRGFRDSELVIADSVNITSSNGKIIVDNINVNNAGKSNFLGDITINSYGAFQAGSDDFVTSFIRGNISTKASVVAPGDISIKHGGKSFQYALGLEKDSDGKLIFRENKDDGRQILINNGELEFANGDTVPQFIKTTIRDTPFDVNNLPENTSFTEGGIFIRGGLDFGLYASFQDTELQNNIETFNIDVTLVPQPPTPPELNQPKKNNICSPEKSKVALNSEASTRDVSSKNNPCKIANDKENILKVIPDNRLNSNSALPTSLLELGER